MSENRMSELGQLLYKKALLLFEQEDYENAVISFIDAYNEGESKEEILQIIYDCFITPNEQEFRESYLKNQNRYLNVPYDRLELDFIPVAENIYYIFDKQDRQFKGRFDCNEGHIEWQKGVTDLFNDYLFADIWDLRQILGYSLLNGYQTSMLISSALEKTASFGKLPYFTEKYMHNIMVLSSKEQFEEIYRQETRLFLPKQLIAGDCAAVLQKMLFDLHMERVKNVEQDRDNVILSICIPSYNRGHRALEAVSKILNTMYDSEIEVIVSNNGSTENVEGYRKIKEIKDSRVVYHEFDENQGFIPNMCKVLSLARGKYAVLSSDEDKIIVEGLPYYLDILRGTSDFGVMMSKFVGANSPMSEDGNLQSFYRIRPGIKAVTQALGLRYITGIIYNVDILKKDQVLEKVLRHADNVYVQVYPHLFINMLVAYRHTSAAGNALLWDCGEAEENVLDENHVLSILVFDGAKNRIEQFKGEMELVCEYISDSIGELKEICLVICKHILYLATVSYYYYHETYYKKKSWSFEYLMTYTRDVCMAEIMDRIGGAVSDKEMQDIMEEIENCYQGFMKEYLEENA